MAEYWADRLAKNLVERKADWSVAHWDWKTAAQKAEHLAVPLAEKKVD